MRSAIDKAIGFLAIAAGLVLCALVVLTFYDVIMRYYFSAPLKGRHDIVEIGMVVSLALAAPYTWRTNGHISVDLYEAIPHRVLERLRSLLVIVIVATLLGLICWRAYFAAEDAALFNEATNMILIPHRPFVFLIMLMAGFHALLVIIDYLRPNRESHSTDSVNSDSDDSHAQ